MAHSQSDSALTLLPDDRLASTPDSHLLSRIAAGETQLQNLCEIAISAASQSLRIAIALGQCFEQLFRRHEGEFSEWLAGALPKKADGSDFISEETARKYRTLWRKRDQIFPPDDSEPACRSLTEAYIKVGILPEPEESDRDPNNVQSQLRLSYHLPDGDPETWPPAERRAFLTKAEPIVRAYQRAMELA